MPTTSFASSSKNFVARMWGVATFLRPRSVGRTSLAKPLPLLPVAGPRPRLSASRHDLCTRSALLLYPVRPTAEGRTPFAARNFVRMLEVEAQEGPANAYSVATGCWTFLRPGPRIPACTGRDDQPRLCWVVNVASEGQPFLSGVVGSSFTPASRPVHRWVLQGVSGFFVSRIDTRTGGVRRSGGKGPAS